MSILLNGDCLELMKDLDDNSVDLIFTDLPYGQVSCEWDVKIDFKQMWEEFMRIKKERTPIFFCCSTKFGVEIINSAPKKCPFRYDIVWVKSAPCGFLSAKKMPMKKHEMLYVFYEKLPFYDLSSHKHKFKEEVVKEDPKWKADTQSKSGDAYGEAYRKNKPTAFQPNKYEPPLPTSVQKEDQCFGTQYLEKKVDYADRKGQPRYEPPLPTSVQKEANTGACYGEEPRDLAEYKECGKKGKNQVLYDPPLPVSVVKEEDRYGVQNIYNGGQPVKELRPEGQIGKGSYDPPLPTSVQKEELLSGGASGLAGGDIYKLTDRKTPLKELRPKGQIGKSYDPPLPVSVVKEGGTYQHLYGEIKDMDYHHLKSKMGNPVYEPPLPTSVQKQGCYDGEKEIRPEDRIGGTPLYEPPLPNSILEIKSQRGKHSTQKPTDLMKWVLKYYSKEGDVVLDPTMGSGSTGVACKEMNRNFIGMELDPEIYEVAVSRIEG